MALWNEKGDPLPRLEIGAPESYSLFLALPTRGAPVLPFRAFFDESDIIFTGGLDFMLRPR